MALLRRRNPTYWNVVDVFRATALSVVVSSPSKLPLGSFAQNESDENGNVAPASAAFVMRSPPVAAVAVRMTASIKNDELPRRIDVSSCTVKTASQNVTVARLLTPDFVWRIPLPPQLLAAFVLAKIVVVTLALLCVGHDVTMLDASTLASEASNHKTTSPAKTDVSSASGAASCGGSGPSGDVTTSLAPSRRRCIATRERVVRAREKKDQTENVPHASSMVRARGGAQPRGAPRFDNRPRGDSARSTRPIPRRSRRRTRATKAARARRSASCACETARPPRAPSR